ncbi:MAG: hypothetical protein IAX21_08325 [Candidatus Bathyarchaeota archaeon]|nr:MAG: hypothetical protein IAX21_08325 [Candidatus Bathyarchaeota archaeon]
MSYQPLVTRLFSCPTGTAGWRTFEDVCTDILIFSLVPPLQQPRMQAHTTSGVQRRDALFPNRIGTAITIWDQLRTTLNANLILFEFKNYKKKKISPSDVDQVNNYLTRGIGNLGIICCPQPASENAKRRRNTIFANSGKVILFLDCENLKELMIIKDRGEDPAGLIMDMLEDFYIQHE